jgi:hypothetical protein
VAHRGRAQSASESLARRAYPRALMVLRCGAIKLRSPARSIEPVLAKKASPPKVMVPKVRTDILRPERPRSRYSMCFSLDPVVTVGSEGL